MPHLSTKKILLAASAILLAGVIVSLARSWSFPDTDWTIEKGKKVTLAGSGATETFTASRDGLSDIRILFGNSRLGGGGTIHFSLLDATCKENIRMSDVHLSGLNSDDTVRFAFPRIPNSKDTTYCLHLTYERDPGTNGAVTLFLTEAIGPAQGSHLTVNNTERPGLSLPMRPSYRNASIAGDFRELTERISQYKPWFGKGAIIATIAILSILLSLGIIVIVILL